MRILVILLLSIVALAWAGNRIESRNRRERAEAMQRYEEQARSDAVAEHEQERWAAIRQRHAADVQP